MSQPFSPKQWKHQKVAFLAFLISAGSFISRILGLFRDMAIGAFFSRAETDAFFVAFRAPNFFRRFLGESALSVSFIPVFVQCLSDSTNKSADKTNSHQRAKNLMNSVYTLLLVVSSVSAS